MSRANRFAKFSGVYTCECCGRQTRSTGGDGASHGMCDPCWELAGYENEMQDGMSGEWTACSMQTIIDYTRKVYEAGGKRVWDRLLQEVVKVAGSRI